MDTFDNERIKAHLRTLYAAQKDSFVWLRDVAASLEAVLQSAREDGIDLSPSLSASLDAMDAALNQAQVNDIALQVIQAALDGELAENSTS